MSLSKPQPGDILVLKRKLEEPSSFRNDLKRRALETSRKKLCISCGKSNEDSPLFTFPSVWKTKNGRKVDSLENVQR